MTTTNSRLPIWALHDAILEALKSGNRLVLAAPTGSGKTTQVPQMLLDAGLAGEKKIVVLQPRRVAARTVAARVAWERNVKLGAEVGYQIRFEDETSLGTRICFVTEGILLRWLQVDRRISDVGVVLFDEFHERNLLSDVALALVKNLQNTSRPDLKMLVMSATLDTKPVAKYLDDCPILVSEGRSYSVEVYYLDRREERSAADQAAEIIEQILHRGEPGDILVFMPGMGEINGTLNACRTIRTSEKLELLPLHGELLAEDQDRAFAASDRRKVVVATNVAETSITIDGIRHVVDSGLARIARYDAERGIGTLSIEEISQASAEQRKGRAGRTAPGTCWRLWTESNHLNRPERNTAEIQRSDLAEVVLLLHSLGIRKAVEFDWLDRPDSIAVERAERLLQTLGALRTPFNDSTDLSDLTPVGRQMLRLPMHPRYSRMMVEAKEFGCVQAAALCAALVSGRDLLMRIGRDDKQTGEAREVFEASHDSDFYTLMRAFQFARNNQFRVDACRRYGIHAQTALQVEQTFQQLLQVAEKQKMLGPAAPETKEDPLPRCIMAGFVDQLCARRDQGTLDCDLTEGRFGALMRESVVQNSPLLVVALIKEIPSRASGNVTLLGLATAVKREWIEARFPEQISVLIEHEYDRVHKRVAAIKLIRFRDLILHREHQRDVDPQASGKALAEAYQKGYFELALFNHELKQLMGRVNLVASVLSELDFPAYDENALTLCLSRAFVGLTLAKEAQAAPLRDHFISFLGGDRLAWLDELAPPSIPWPDGRKVKLLYAEGVRTPDREIGAPEAQVKLHECFTLKVHPHICEGKVPVKLWLCAPDGKRIEATSNWPAFRTAQYPKLKAQLQKKYPGIPWI